MTPLGKALREKFKTPREAVEALGLDAALIADSKENTMKSTRFAHAMLMTTASAIRPLLAMDQKVDLTPVFKGVAAKTFKTNKPAFITALRTATKGKLAQDGSIEPLIELLEAISPDDKAVDESATEAQEKAIAARAIVDPEVISMAKGRDAMASFLKGKGMADDDIKAACDMMPDDDVDGLDESPEDKAKREKEEADKKTADDAELDKTKKELEAKDAEMKNMVTKPAMDAAISSAVTSAVKQARETERGIRVALDKVRPLVGELKPELGLDSAEAVHRHALKMLGVEGANTIHASALETVLGLQGRPAPATHQPAQIALDAASTKSFNDRFPGADRIQSVV